MCFFFPVNNFKERKFSPSPFLSYHCYSIHFAITTENNFLFKMTRSALSDAPRLRKQVPRPEGLEHRQALFSSGPHSTSQLQAELPSAGSYDDCRSTRETVGLLTPHQGAPGSRANQPRSKDQTPPVSPPPDEVNALSPPSPRLPTRQALIHMRKHVHHAAT